MIFQSSFYINLIIVCVFLLECFEMIIGAVSFEHRRMLYVGRFNYDMARY